MKPAEHSRMDRRHKTLRCLGFTMVEMLVVIGIVIVLISIALLGLKSLGTTANTNRTKTMLHDAAAMLTEYENATAMRRQPYEMWAPGPPLSRYTAGFNIWRDSDPSLVGEQPLAAPVKLLDADANDPADATSDRFYSQAVVNTAEVMREISQMPGTKKVVSQLPADAFLTIREPAGTTVIHQVMLDAWGNPIIFVPATGLARVALVDKDNPSNPYIVTSTKVYSASLAGAAPPNVRPFFASAGPDGVFGFIDKNSNGTFEVGVDLPAGDDNLYSFLN
jgi:type II secretory pathway pseudopilin PulG